MKAKLVVIAAILSVGALMAGSPVPAGAQSGGWTADGCRAGDGLTFVLPGEHADRNGDLAVCDTGTRHYDNHLSE